MAIVNEFGQPYTFAHAADRSTRRGPQFATRNDDIDRLIPSSDRRTIASLSQRLFMNMGVPQACIRQKADYSVGDAWLPIYTGPDKENGKAAAKFMADFWYPQCSTIGGNFDWWKMLEITSIQMDVPGDDFWILVKGQDGFPRIQQIPSHRCRSEYGDAIINENGPYKGYRINDGVISYASGRVAAYRFDVGKQGSPQFKDIPASDVISFYDPIFPNQQRGFPAFTHALESLKMSLFSTEDERIRQQIISRLHLTIFNESGGPDPDEPDTILQDSGDSNFSSKFFPGGTVYMPNDGSRIEQMKHDNPGDVWESFQDRIVRDAVAPVWSYSVWKSTGQGTAERGEVLKCRKFIEKRQRDLFIGARRAFAWAYSILAESGRAPRVQNPLAWDFSRPPRLTVDDGRESKMELDELRTGARNMDEVLGARGLTEDEFFDRRARSVWKRKFTALKVAEELNAANGVEIEVEDREMFMQTPNEMGEPDKTDAPDNNQDDKQTTQEDDDA